MKKNAIIGFPLLLLCGALVSGTVAAEVLRIPAGQQASEKKDLEKPKPGSSKNDVERKFGEPLEWTDPVGDPPISSWEYKDYVVFFEHNLVLHTVLKTNGRPVELTE